jgi:hypothetical protein
MADPLQNFTATPNSFGTKGAIIAPSANDLPATVKAITLLTAGDVTIVPVGNADGETLAYVGCAAGFSPPYRVRRVTAATATVASVTD